MPRVAIPVTVLDATGVPLSGKSVTVRKRSDNSLATLFTTETGATNAANPLSTDAQGRVTGWVDRNAYKLTITGSGITTYDEQFDAVPGADAGIDAAALGASIIPLGVVTAYAGASDPAGGNWLICDGRALSRTTYSGLFGIIGTAYGVGDGSTTFNIPDLKGRVPLGAGVPANPSVTGGSVHALGSKGGEETHTLTTAELAAHGHGLNDPGHAHQFGRGAAAGGGASAWASSTFDFTATIAASLTGMSVQNAGGGGSHNNLPPFTATNFLIRAL